MGYKGFIGARRSHRSQQDSRQKGHKNSRAYFTGSVKFVKKITWILWNNRQGLVIEEFPFFNCSQIESFKMYGADAFVYKDRLAQLGGINKCINETEIVNKDSQIFTRKKIFCTISKIPLLNINKNYLHAN